MKRDALVATASVALLLLAWELVPRIIGISSLILPTFSDVLQSAWETRSAILAQATITAWATLAATLLAVFTAILLVTIATLSPLVSSALAPFILAGQALPKVVLIPLLFLTISNVTIPGIVVGTLIAFFPVYITLRFAIETIPRGLLDLASVWQYTKLRTVIVIGIPYALPAAVSTFRMAWIYAMIGVVSAELLHPAQGIGFLLDQAQSQLDGRGFYAAALVSLLLALAGWFAASTIDKRVRQNYRIYDAKEVL
jgi:NitT/TauT family transport system permease protein